MDNTDVALQSSLRFVGLELDMAWKLVCNFEASMGYGPDSPEFLAARFASETMVRAIANALRNSGHPGFDSCTFLTLSGMVCSTSGSKSWHTHDYEPTKQYVTNWAERHNP